MTSPTVQRWRARRDSYRPAGEVIQTSAYEVAAIPDDTTARAFVEAHHYSSTFPAARARVGLYRGAELVGVAVFSVPPSPRVLGAVFPAGVEGVELGRFVLLDDVPGNGETWFLARAFALVRDRFEGVLSFSDPLPRRDETGRVVTPGHLGVIYQAFNGVYLGRGPVRTIRLLRSGRTFSARAASKIRAREKGWRYAAAQLVAAGAVSPGENEDLAAWLRAWLPRVTRTVKHPGTHKYAWALDRRLRRHLVASGPYPKRMERAA